MGIPKSIANNFNRFEITGDHNILVLSDIHIPYHSEQALEIAVNSGKRKKIDTVILNGDIIDCYAVSRWERDPDKRFLRDEIMLTREFIHYLRQKFKSADIIFKYGNHEERYIKYLYKKAPELFGISEMQLKSLLHLDKYGVTTLENKEPIKVNELFILHGHEYFATYNIVSPARSIYNKTKKNTLIGHYHQPSTYSEPNLDGHYITCWSSGCLSNLYPAYMPLNKWSWGFVELETYGQKEFNVFNYRIINNKVYRV
ncbi:MAG: hypothetical protein HPY57_13215 [Ignavibacteria bacterium]|nr:hypothetical protein [Ignavibacteria bacterium]